MQRLFDEMRERLEAFLAQRDAAVLVASCGPTECEAVRMTLVDLEASRDEAYWYFTASFRTPEEWLLGIAEEFRLRYEMVRELSKVEGDPLPLLPPGWFDPRGGVVEAAKRIFGFARDLAADIDATHGVMVITPVEITNHVAFSEVVFALANDPGLFPWFHHMRLIVREDAAQPMLRNQAQDRMPRARFYSPDLSQAAVEKAMDDEIGDDSIPLPKRMQSLFILGGADIAANRCTDAIKKYSLLARYHAVVGPKSMFALSLNGVGEAFMRGGDPVRARDFFARALVPAAEAKDPQSLVNIAFNLAYLYRSQSQWKPALDHYAALGALAKAFANAPLMMMSHEQAGFCAYKLGDWRRAHDEWRACVTLARGIDDKEVLLASLDRIRALYQEAGMRERREQVDEEIRDVERTGARRAPR